MQSPSQTWAKLELTGMRSDILVCERSAHPVLLHCLQDESHDWRHLQLVNASMCAAFRQYKAQVAEYMAKRELRKRCAEMAAQCAAFMSMYTNAPSGLIFANNILHPPSSVIDDDHRIFAWGLLVTAGAAEAGPEEETPVLEVD